jgi:hypothetical protein
LRSAAVPVEQRLSRHSFDPDDIKVLSGAFEEALRELKLVDRTAQRNSLLNASLNLRGRASVTLFDSGMVPLREFGKTLRCVSLASLEYLKGILLRRASVFMGKD